MRPLWLQIQALGPYAGTEVLDFRDGLGDSSFFLIHGATGSGKTTILDALCFALYGETSGEQRDFRTLRSQHAPADLPTVIELEFSLGPRFFRIRREPMQERPRLRGDGLIRTSAKADLWELPEPRAPDTAGNHLASKQNETTATITDLLGFSAAQFRQVIILPQGEFRRLLSADSKDREAILQTLFGTDIYRRIQEGLSNQARALHQAAVSQQSRIQALLEAAAVADADALQAAHDAALAAATQAEAAVEQAQRSANLADQALQTARRLAERRLELATARQTLSKLMDGRARHERAVATLAAARRAAELVALETELVARRDAAKAARDDAAEAQDRAAKSRQARVRAAAEVDLLQRSAAAHDSLRERVDRLRQCGPRVAELAAAREQFAAAEAAVAAAVTQEQTLQRASRKLETELATTRQRRQDLERLATTLAAVANERQQLRVWQGQLGHLAAARGARRKLLDGAAQQRARAELAATNLSLERKQLHELESHWLASQAGILVHELEVGKPCPVCGSRSHPKPAEPSDDVPDRARLSRQRERVSELETIAAQAREAVQAHRDQITELSARVTALEETLGSAATESAAELAAKLSDAESRWQQAEAAAAELPRLAERLHDLEAQAAEQTTKLAQLRQNLVDQQADLGRWRTVVEERSRALPDGIETVAQLKRQLQAAENELGALDRRRQAAEDALAAATEAALTEAALAGATVQRSKQAGDDLAAVNSRFTNRREALGFASNDAFEASRAEVANIDQLTRETEAFSGAWRSAHDHAERLAAELRETEPPDLESLSAAAQEAQAALTDAIRAETEAHHRRDDLARHCRHLGQIQEASAEAEASWATVQDLSEVAAGRWSGRVNLQRYVLGSMLDLVLEAATLRLRTMSRGRYQLQRARDPRDQRGAGGLDLDVFDNYTGYSRPVSTLSGGEGFLAALALALGLAETVQSTAGGRRLDTILIDEGFGNLDPDSLDLALRSLLDLRADGRLVGIISHVPELRERIDVRLRVSMARNGSTTCFVRD